MGLMNFKYTSELLSTYVLVWPILAKLSVLFKFDLNASLDASTMKFGLLRHQLGLWMHLYVYVKAVACCVGRCNLSLIVKKIYGNKLSNSFKQMGFL